MRRCIIVLTLAALLPACAAAPGPAPIEVPGATQTATAPTVEPLLGELNVGIDPIEGGFNPHLVKDDSRFVRSLSELVFPRPFRNGVMDTDLVVSVELIDELHLRYRLNTDAQWSDGTPITVADFDYLYQSIVNTTGARNAALYRTIEDISSSEGGRVVEVRLNQPVADYTQFFDGLLPSHLLRGDYFGTVLDTVVPAAGGKFEVENIDNTRGVVVLNRNDRFWGAEAAKVDTVSFWEIRRLEQALDMMESGQVVFLDITPTETATEALGLQEKVQLRHEVADRQMEVVLSTDIPLQQRQVIRSLVDTKKLSSLAFGRRSDLAVVDNPYNAAPLPVDPGMKKVTVSTTADNDVLEAAAQRLVTMLDQAGVPAVMASPGVKGSMVLTWNSEPLINTYQCAHGGLWGSNQARYCSEDTDKVITDVLAGKMSVPEFVAYTEQLETELAFRVPIARDLRLEVVSSRVTGPAADFQQWPAGMSSLATWKVNGS